MEEVKASAERQNNTPKPLKGEQKEIADALAAWAALALNGGVRSTVGPGRGKTPATQVFPLFERLLPNEPVCCDIKMQEYHIRGVGMVHGAFKKNGKEEPRAGQKRWAHRIGNICICNMAGEVLLFCYVRYPEDPNIEVKLPYGFGVKWSLLRAENGAVDAAVAETWCQKIFANRQVIPHGGETDQKAFFYLAQKGLSPFVGNGAQIVDTQHIYGQAKLETLADTYLGRTIQQGGHDVVEDTIATKDIFMRQSTYDRIAEQRAFNALPEAEQKAYFATSPKIAWHLYQGNIFPSMPEDAKQKILQERQQKAKSTARGGQ